MELCSVENEGKRCRVVLPRDFNDELVSEIRLGLHMACSESVNEVVFDLSQTIMLHSRAIGLMVAMSKQMAEQNGRVCLVNVPPYVMQVLTSMRLSSRFCVSPMGAS